MSQPQLSVREKAREMFDAKFVHDSHIDLSGKYCAEPLKKISGEIEVINKIHEFIDQIITLALEEKIKEVEKLPKTIIQMGVDEKGMAFEIVEKTVRLDDLIEILKQ